LGINPKVIPEELAIASGPKARSYPTVIDWGKRFHKNREDINDDLHSTYRHIIIAETSLFHSTIERIIYDHLKLRKVPSCWVSH